MSANLRRREAMTMMVGSWVGTLVAGAEVQPKATAEMREGQRKLWKAVHIMASNPNGLPSLMRAIEEQLAPLGVNVIGV